MLNDFGFSSSFIHLINSYLTDRSQFVQIEDKKFALAQGMCGVPQDSILGPIFSIYMLQTCLHLYQVCAFNSLTILPCINDANLKIYLMVLTLFKTM